MGDPKKTCPTTMATAIPDNARISKIGSDLEKAGVKYVFSCWVDILGCPKTKPVPDSEFESLCIGKGPRFAVHDLKTEERAECQVQPLPRRSGEAVAGFAPDAPAKNAFGHTPHKQHEWDRFHETVTERERRECLRFYEGWEAVRS